MIGLYNFKYVVCSHEEPIAIFHDLEQAQNFLAKHLIANRIIELRD